MPGFEAHDGVPQGGQLDVGIERMHISPMAVAHEFFAHVRDHACLDQARVEGVAQIVEAAVWNSRTPDGCRPGGLDPAQRHSLEGEYKP